MRRTLIPLAVSGLALIGSSAFAQAVTSTTVTQKPSEGAAVGVVGGAATGAAIGGPVGAVIGGVVGATAGAAIDPPAEVRTYVESQNVPVLNYNGQLMVGQPLPSTIAVYQVPNQTQFDWAYVNGQRYVIDRTSRNIVSVIPATTTTAVTTRQESEGAVAGVATGVATGAIVGGPVGAAVGAVVGGVAGLLADPPSEVTTYVRSQNVPAATYSGQITVGQALPSVIGTYDVPSDPRYAWAYVNGQRMLIDRSNLKVVSILP